MNALELFTWRMESGYRHMEIGQMGMSTRLTMKCFRGYVNVDERVPPFTYDQFLEDICGLAMNHIVME